MNLVQKVLNMAETIGNLLTVNSIHSLKNCFQAKLLEEIQFLR